MAKELGASAQEDHWAVRDLAAAAMGLLLEKFGPAYPELLSRVSNQLLKGLLDPSKPLTTHYGTPLSPAPFEASQLHCKRDMPCLYL